MRRGGRREAGPGSRHPSPGSLPLLGREEEIAKLNLLFDGEGVRTVTVVGPRGVGKTALVAAALRGRSSLHFQATPLTDGDLFRDLEGVARATLGEAPASRRPGILPLTTGRGGWPSFFRGVCDRLETGGDPFVLALDGVEALLSARRRILSEIAELVGTARARSLPLVLLLVARRARTLSPLTSVQGTIGPADVELTLPALPYRTAGWAHGGQDPRDAFIRWAILGDHPAHLRREDAGETVSELVVRRVLESSGDLFDAPIRRLEATFQRPARYASILRALAEGPLDWSGILNRAEGIDSGAQLSPYLHRLEEEGLVRSDRPLDAKPGSRRRRYALADPFIGFWFGQVLPLRSLLLTDGGGAVWQDRILPGLSGHLQRWMEEAARRWLRDHAEEGFGAAAREAGALWGGEADFPAAARLGNGQICYGLVQWEGGGSELPGEMARRMADTRYGIGRQTRSALYFLSDDPGENLRRSVARDSMARVVELSTLMGSG